MIKDIDNKGISTEVYEINNKIEYKEGGRILNNKYEILAVENNKDNGMQAMAVAPVDSNGEVDTSQIVIAYAGTDFSD